MYHYNILVETRGLRPVYSACMNYPDMWTLFNKDYDVTVRIPSSNVNDMTLSLQWVYASIQSYFYEFCDVIISVTPHGYATLLILSVYSAF